MRAFRLRFTAGRWYVEVPLLVGGYFAFGLARAAVDRGDPAATSDAVLLQRLERSLHVALESSLNHAMLAQPAAIYATGYVCRLALLTVPVTLVWLYVRHRARYGPLQTALVVTTALDLPLVWAFPEAPPRFAQEGIVDYIATHREPLPPGRAGRRGDRRAGAAVDRMGRLRRGTDVPEAIRLPGSGERLTA